MTKAIWHSGHHIGQNIHCRKFYSKAVYWSFLLGCLQRTSNSTRSTLKSTCLFLLTLKKESTYANWFFSNVLYLKQHHNLPILLNQKPSHPNFFLLPNLPHPSGKNGFFNFLYVFNWYTYFHLHRSHFHAGHHNLSFRILLQFPNCSPASSLNSKPFPISFCCQNILSKTQIWLLISCPKLHMVYKDHVWSLSSSHIQALMTANI